MQKSLLFIVFFCVQSLIKLLSSYGIRGQRTVCVNKDQPTMQTAIMWTVPISCRGKFTKLKALDVLFSVHGYLKNYRKEYMY